MNNTPLWNVEETAIKWTSCPKWLSLISLSCMTILRLLSTVIFRYCSASRVKMPMLCYQTGKFDQKSIEPVVWQQWIKSHNCVYIVFSSDVVKLMHSLNYQLCSCFYMMIGIFSMMTEVHYWRLIWVYFDQEKMSIGFLIEASTISHIKTCFAYNQCTLWKKSNAPVYDSNWTTVLETQSLSSMVDRPWDSFQHSMYAVCLGDF